MAKNEINSMIKRRFGRLVIMAFAGLYKNTRNRQWKCQCDCGVVKVIRGGPLMNGSTQSCGCLSKEILKKRLTTHGRSHTLEYNTWQNMIKRTTNPKHPRYKDWGGRGIRVCDRWHFSFEAFFADMGLCPGPEYSIERRDNDGDYCPENCYWELKVNQPRNTRRNRWIEFNGELLLLTDWAKKLGIGWEALHWRIKHWPLERALTERVKEDRRRKL